MNISVRQYQDLLRIYLEAQKGSVLLLALLLLTSIGLQLFSPQVIRRYIDLVQIGAALEALIVAALVFLVVVVAQRALNVAVTYVSQRVAWTATNGLRSDLTRHVLTLDLSFHNSHTPGELLQRIDGDVVRLANFFSEFLLQIVSGLLLTVGVLVLLFLEDWRIAAVLAVFVVAYVAIHFWDQQWATPEWRKERVYSAELAGFVEERIAGVRDIQTSGAVDYTMRRFLELLQRRQWQELRAAVITDLGWGLSKTFYGLGTVAGMAVGAYLYLTGSITLGTVYLIIFYLGMLNGPLNRIANQLEDLQRVRVSIERVSELLATNACIVDGSGVDLPVGKSLAVSYDQVSCSYQPGTPVLRDVSFSLVPGQVLGLLGRTGSGKTTLSRLLSRLIDPDSGVIAIDGSDIQDARLADLRRSVGVVTQDVQLFPASVRNNLSLFDPTVADESIIEGLSRLGLDDWLSRLPDGLDTELAANGGGLSAGEGQLLALTRIFLKDPGLVILDEASSRLDPATERLLERALDGLLRGRTAIIIAHRLSTVNRADTILILDRGAVAEFGPYEILTDDPDSIFSGLLNTGLEEVLA